MSAPLLGPGALAALVRRPGLWPVAARVGWRMAPRGWWRRWPPSPRPDPAYVQFRLEAMYGHGPGPGLGPGELVGYLEWCRRLPRRSR